jgi:hypothetical protein
MLIRPDLLLRLEALLVLLAALICYSGLHGEWLLFAVLFLIPDLSLLGYLSRGNGRFPAAVYNLVHSYAVPVVVGMIGWKLGSVFSERITVIWIAHIAFDRLVGYGLKYAQAPRPTHIQSARFYRPV